MAVTLVVEDGSGVTGANAYIDVAFADQYHLDRFNSDWAGSDDRKSSAILQATRYLNRTYVFQGIRTHEFQELEWPRVRVYTDDGDELPREDIPTVIEEASAEVALVILCHGDPDKSFVESEARTRRERVGVIEAEFEYDGTEGSTSLPRVDAILASVIASRQHGGGSSPIVRA